MVRKTRRWCHFANHHKPYFLKACLASDPEGRSKERCRRLGGLKQLHGARATGKVMGIRRVGERNSSPIAITLGETRNSKPHDVIDAAIINQLLLRMAAEIETPPGPPQSRAIMMPCHAVLLYAAPKCVRGFGRVYAVHPLRIRWIAGRKRVAHISLCGGLLAQHKDRREPKNRRDSHSLTVILSTEQAFRLSKTG